MWEEQVAVFSPWFFKLVWKGQRSGGNRLVLRRSRKLNIKNLLKKNLLFLVTETIVPSLQY